jgi:hypothetical protein
MSSTASSGEDVVARALQKAKAMVESGGVFILVRLHNYAKRLTSLLH